MGKWKVSCPGVRSKKILCKVVLLERKEKSFLIENKANGSVLLMQVFEFLDIMECDYFGLFFRESSGIRHWIEPNKLILKQVKNAEFCFYFSVKFYPPDPNHTLKEITLYYIDLQIRKDIVERKILCPTSTHAILGSFVLQSELGDFDSEVMIGNYAQNFSLAPNQTPDLEERVMELHKALKGQTREEAERNYFNVAKSLTLFGTDLHFSQDISAGKVMIGINWKGIAIYNDCNLAYTFVWGDIVKLSYRGKKFYIIVKSGYPQELSTLGFKMSDHGAAKTVWKSSVEHYSFFRFCSFPKIDRLFNLTSSVQIFHRLPHNAKSRHSRQLRPGSKFRFKGRTLSEMKSFVSKQTTRLPPSVYRTEKITHSGRVEVDQPNTGLTLEDPPASTPSAGPSNADNKLENSEQSAVILAAPQTHNLKEHTIVESSSDEEWDKYSNPIPLEMTEHQKFVERLKVDFLNFDSHGVLQSPNPLESIDARLTPRKPSHCLSVSGSSLSDEFNRTGSNTSSSSVSLSTASSISIEESDADRFSLGEVPLRVKFSSDEEDTSFDVSLASSEGIVIPENAPGSDEDLLDASSASSNQHASSPVVRFPDDESTSFSSSASSLANGVVTNHVLEGDDRTAYFVTSNVDAIVTSSHDANRSESDALVRIVEMETVIAEEFLFSAVQAQQLPLTDDNGNGETVRNASANGLSTG